MTVLEKSGLYLCVGVIIGLLLFIIFADHGLVDYKKLKAKERQVAAQSLLIEKKNRILEAEIEKLKSDAEYIKHVAKHEYEMVEKDEIIFKDEHPK